MAFVIVTSGPRVTIPRELAEKVRVKVGDLLDASIERGAIVYRKAKVAVEKR